MSAFCLMGRCFVGRSRVGRSLTKLKGVACGFSQRQYWNGSPSLSASVHSFVLISSLNTSYHSPRLALIIVHHAFYSTSPRPPEIVANNLTVYHIRLQVSRGRIFPIFGQITMGYHASTYTRHVCVFYLESLSFRAVAVCLYFVLRRCTYWQ